jgi:hypothetical protein
LNGVVSEALCVGKLQKFIKLSFVTDGAAKPRSDVGAAGGTCPVIWVDDYVIGQLQIKIV